MTITDSRLTEERLRCHLDSNQVMRERLCLALMPLLGPYTRECPRRPKGGPDGGRDIEAIYDGSIVAWGAVGFRNGGGNDEQARKEASEKFQNDLERALSENPTLKAFVFFTNVDLTPLLIEQLKERAVARGISIIDVVDLERLRHALDSPEGLIARLQYLDIPMSSTEQIALVNKFGNQLQNAISSRFDRVEQTLSQMERFLVFQKPLQRLDIFVILKKEQNSIEIGNEAILLEITGLQNVNKTVSCLLLNVTSHPLSNSKLITLSYLWLQEKKNKAITFVPSIGISPSIMAAYCELSLTTSGYRVRIADLSVISLTVYLSKKLYPLVERILVDANGYELFNYSISNQTNEAVIDLPDQIPVPIKDLKWMKSSSSIKRDFIFELPVLSGRLSPLYHI